MTLNLNEGGVNQGPFGSLIRDKYGIDNSRQDAIFSPEGLAALRLVLTSYKDAGANIGGAPTFRLTDFRASADSDWEYDPAKRLYLQDSTTGRNQQAVELVRQVFGERIVGLVAPICDTSGKHDEKWSALGKNQVDWAIQRQEPQIQVLHQAGVDVIWGEAFRYRNEALALVRSAKKVGAKAVVVSFEANENGVPDPENGGSYTFTDLKRDLQAEAGDELEVFVGANCTGIKNISRIWARGDLVDVAYPNSLNFGDHDKLEFATLVERPHKTPQESARIKRMLADFATPLPDFVDFWREAFRERGVKIAGGCCGTTPAHTWVAKQAFNEAQAERAQ